jgi:hypothetical protein
MRDQEDCMSKRDEELQMNSRKRRDLITASVKDAVRAFCDVGSGG